MSSNTFRSLCQCEVQHMCEGGTGPAFCHEAAGRCGLLHMFRPRSIFGGPSDWSILGRLDRDPPSQSNRFVRAKLLFQQCGLLWHALVDPWRAEVDQLPKRGGCTHVFRLLCLDRCSKRTEKIREIIMEVEFTTCLVFGFHGHPKRGHPLPDYNCSRECR